MQDVLPGLDLLPAPGDLLGSCGCIDHVPLCEHVMAALHGFGARLDAEPELLLLLRGIEVESLAAPTSLLIAPLTPGKIALTGGLAALFGLNLRDEPLPVPEDAMTAELAAEQLPDPANGAHEPATQEPPPDTATGVPDSVVGVGDGVEQAAMETASSELLPASRPGPRDCSGHRRQVVPLVVATIELEPDASSSNWTARR